MSHPRYIRYILRMVLIGLITSVIVIGATVAVGWHYRARIAQVLLVTVPKVATPKVPLAPIITPVPAPIKPAVILPPVTVASAVAKVNKSVVSIEVAQPMPNYTVNADGSVAETDTLQTIGGGSGFFISHSGLILTNKHVVDFDNAAFTIVTASGAQYQAVVVAKDPNLDIALLQVQTVGTASFPPVTFGDSSTLQLGQNVVAIGYALGELTNSISAGIVSGLARDITAGDAANGSTENLSQLIQTDAAINPGNSGGPLLTLDGMVIGVNVATATGSQSIGFALPINEVKSFVRANS